jgi:hypothetical protein
MATPATLLSPGPAEGYPAGRARPDPEVADLEASEIRLAALDKVNL